MTPYIDLRFHFDADIEEEYTHYSMSRITRISNDEIPRDSIISIQEGLAQSDFGFIDMPNGVITALDGTEVDFKKDKY